MKIQTPQLRTMMRALSRLCWRKAADTWSRRSVSWLWLTQSSPSSALSATTASRYALANSRSAYLDDLASSPNDNPEWCKHSDGRYRWWFSSGRRRWPGDWSLTGCMWRSSPRRRTSKGSGTDWSSTRRMFKHFIQEAVWRCLAVTISVVPVRGYTM